MEVTNAVRQKLKASILIEGLQGTGKSGLALMIAKALGTPGVIDTENKSTDLFVGTQLSDGSTCESFKKVDLGEEEVTPSTILEARKLLQGVGCDAIVQDSTSHSWLGLLNNVTKLTEANSKVNNFNAWGKPEISSEKDIITRKLFRDSSCHIISTVRLKEKFTMTPEGKVESKGEQEVMQDGAQYEPDLVLRMVKPGTPDGDPPMVEVRKSRYAFLRLGQIYEITPAILAMLASYLDDGVDPAELDAQMAKDLIVSITDVMKTSSLKKMQWQQWCKANKMEATTKLTDLSLAQLQSLYKALTFN